MITGSIKMISGPVVHAKDMRGSKMYDVVRVGKEKLLGEIIQLFDDIAVIQVYEETAGLRPDEPVVSTEEPLTIELGPGLIKNIYDGIGRPLKDLSEMSGDFISRGLVVSSLDRDMVYDFRPTMKVGQNVSAGQVIGEAKESELIMHKVMISPGIEGKITKIVKGKKNIDDVIAVVQNGSKKHNITLSTRWPVRKPRPYKHKLQPDIPLITGRRIFDTFFPIAKGGVAAIPGPFGAGKTVTQQDLAKWSDADIIVYIGCGERGNEMTDVLKEFPELKDPKSGKPLMERTILIANTSNMPVAAREASIYTGITIAEYYRDMGYNVALMADSTSRWAESMREISSRLEEMPGEEGYPAYLSSKLAQFYERAGRCTCLNGVSGSVTAIGAVSPPGGDFSEPVTQNTLRIVKVFWGLDSSLAYKRHFPSINWLTSYSLYDLPLQSYFNKNIAKDFSDLKNSAMKLLQKESELQEIVQLVGPDALPEPDKLVLYTTKSLREDYLQQNSFDKEDAYCSLEKQYIMLKTTMNHYHRCKEAIENGLVRVNYLTGLKINEMIARLRYSKDITKDSKKVEQESIDCVSKGGGDQ